MTIFNSVIGVICCFVISFAYIRGFLYGVKRYRLNNSAYKKIKKGETFKQWFFYSRYKSVIPTLWRAVYYTILLLHLSAFICIFFVVLTWISLSIADKLIAILFYFDAAWISLTMICFWQPKSGFKYERWITKTKEGIKSRKKRDGDTGEGSVR